jgi:hypothetical protein
MARYARRSPSTRPSREVSTSEPTERTRELIARLQHGDVDDRSSAALRLNLDLHPKAIDALRTALGDEATEVRESAAQSLALLGDTSSLEAVVRVARLSDASWPRASLWAACALAATSSDAAWIVRAHRLIEDLTLDGPPAARQQAEYLRRELAGGSRDERRVGPDLGPESCGRQVLLLVDQRERPERQRGDPRRVGHDRDRHLRRAGEPTPAPAGELGPGSWRHPRGVDGLGQRAPRAPDRQPPDPGRITRSVGLVQLPRHGHTDWSRPRLASVRPASTDCQRRRLGHLHRRRRLASHLHQPDRFPDRDVHETIDPVRYSGPRHGGDPRSFHPDVSRPEQGRL